MLPQLSYPIDNREAYQARIRFSVMTADRLDEIIKKQVAAQPKDNTPSNLPPSERARRDQLRASADKETEKRVNKTIQVGPKYAKNTKNFPIVSLFLPIALQFNDAVEYNNINLGVIGGDISGAITSGQSLAQGVMGALAKTGTTVSDIARGNASLASEIGRTAAARFTPGTIGSAVRLATQTAVNPNTRVLFNSVGLRQFTFQFKMIPTSKAESIAIEGIVKHFRTELYPALIAENTGYDFPNGFDIAVQHRNKEIKTQKFPPVFLQKVDTVYNSTSGVFHEDGYPSEVDMTLMFTEMKALSKADIVERGL